MDKIDFVLPWVDGSDADWIKQRNEYLGHGDISLCGLTGIIRNLQL